MSGIIGVSQDMRSGVVGGWPSGHVLQVKSTAKTDTFGHSSGSFTFVTGLSVAITPHQSVSKIMVIASVVLGSHTAFGTYGGMRVTANVDGGSYGAINVGASSGSRSQTAAWIQGKHANDLEYVASNFLHTPTYDLGEELIYRVETNAQAGGYDVWVNRCGSDGNAAYEGRGASNITIMEVVA